MCFCCCVWLVSGKKERRVRAPRAPRGQPEAPSPNRAALKGPRGCSPQPLHLLIADVFSCPLRYVQWHAVCARTHKQTYKEGSMYCVALHCVVCHCLCSQPVVVVMLLLCLLVCLLLHISGKRSTHTHTQPEACWTTLSMCLCALVESQSVISF